ncbi:MAG: 2-hydroxyacid dehydrogenase [Halofilum sp. (in: g-proteobacteria)]|nr:2-hydroxyacid dehydrogenase [Halofilum sp. (in: g-proteobacteria)]
MNGVILDADSLGPGLDLTRLRDQLDHWDWHGHTAPEETANRIREADVVITNKVVLDAAAFAAAPRLQLVCVAATGINNIDLDAAREHGVTVCNATGYGTPSVVQHTFALILALATRLPDYQAAVRAGEWSRSPFFCLLDFPITELAGKTLGVIGYGTLGQGVAGIARAFDMDVRIAARPGATEIPADRIAVEDLLEQADVLTLHCPLTDATRGLIGRAELERMKPDALLVNTARGGIVDEAALADALRAGAIGGAGMDVLTQEPPRDGNPLLADDIPNLIVTPHSAWGSQAARQRLVEQVADHIANFRAGKPSNVVAGPEGT